MADSARDQAVKMAQALFAQKVREGLDLSNGPCLSEEIIPDWCVDVAHSPRRMIDNLPENQCASYREGRVHHFVELDPSGKVIRAL